MIEELCLRARGLLSRADADPTRPRPAFLVLRTESGAVRGSVGTTVPDRPLEELVPSLVREAAADPRHPPLAAGEPVSLELWLLAASPRRVDDPAAIDPTADALRVRRGLFSGTLLPDVAIERGWNGATALAYACRKAGLSAQAWRDAQTEVLAWRSTLLRE